jgi:hypothetical protein
VGRLMVTAIGPPEIFWSICRCFAPHLNPQQ